MAFLKAVILSWLAVFVSLCLSASIPSLILPTNTSEASDDTLLTPSSIENPPLGSLFPRAWPAAPFTWTASRGMKLHVNYYENANIKSALLSGLTAIIPNSFSLFVLHRNLGLDDVAPPQIMIFPAPTHDAYDRPLLYPANVEVEFMNTPEELGAPYTVRAMEITIRAIIKKIQTSKVGHYAVIKPEIDSVRYKSVFIQRRT